MESMTLPQRLEYDLNSVRGELSEEAVRFSAEEFIWTPAPGMRSCRDLLLEIGTMEAVCTAWLISGEMPDWQTEANMLSARATTPRTLLAALDAIRAKTLDYLENASIHTLRTPVLLPEGWDDYFGAKAAEPEEFVRWIVRHEYYHLGQLVIYRWQLGDDPYKRS